MTICTLDIGNAHPSQEKLKDMYTTFVTIVLSITIRYIYCHNILYNFHSDWRK